MSQGHDDLMDHSPSRHDHKQFQFTIKDDVVTEVFELKDGQLKQKSIDDSSENYVVNGSEIEHVEQKSLGTEFTRYADTNGDGIYTRVFERWESNTDSLNQGFQFDDELRYTPTDDSDDIAVRGGEDSQGGKGEDSFVIREAAHLRIGDFHADENDDIVFDTGLGLTSKEQLASYIKEIRQEGDDFVVDFGPGISIRLVGVHAGQISWDDVTILS
ncbi:MAG: hypothetical protein WAU15_11680 [Nitrosomonas sp.]